MKKTRLGKFPLVLVYVPCPSAKIANKLAHQILDQKLAACVQILPPVKSQFIWKGKLETAFEVPLLCKTRLQLIQSLKKFLLETHPYEAPAILSWRVDSASEDYFLWVGKS